MRLYAGFFLVVASACGQETNVTRMLDAKLTEAQRNDACFALRDERTVEVMSAMRTALNVDILRACAARNLGRGEAGNLLADALHDRDPEVRVAAARELGLMKREEFIPVLAAAARDPNLLVSASAVESLCQFEDRLAVLPVLKTIAGQGGIPGAISLSRIAVLDKSEALPFARKLLDGPDVTERLTALRILGESGDSTDLPALRAMSEQKMEVTVRQRGFGLIPPIDLSRAAQATMAQIETRMIALRR